MDFLYHLLNLFCCVLACCVNSHHAPHLYLNESYFAFFEFCFVLWMFFLFENRVSIWNISTKTRSLCLDSHFLSHSRFVYCNRCSISVSDIPRSLCETYNAFSGISYNLPFTYNYSIMRKFLKNIRESFSSKNWKKLCRLKDSNSCKLIVNLLFYHYFRRNAFGDENRVFLC